MAFTDDINTIRLAQYGRDVREAIAAALENCYEAEKNFNAAYATAITELNQRINEAIADTVQRATASAATAAESAINAKADEGIAAISAAYNSAVTRLDEYASSQNLTLEGLGLVYSESEPGNKKNGMVWLKPVAES